MMKDCAFIGRKFKKKEFKDKAKKAMIIALSYKIQWW